MARGIGSEAGRERHPDRRAEGEVTRSRMEWGQSGNRECEREGRGGGRGGFFEDAIASVAIAASNS